MAGERMAAEMAEQPDRLGALLARWDGAVAQVRALAWPELAGSVIVARGSSDAAGAYGRYLLELVSRRPVSMAAPSLHTLYGADVGYARFLAVAVSQSASWWISSLKVRNVRTGRSSRSGGTATT